MPRWWSLGWVVGLVACGESPCEHLNAHLTEHYEACGVALPADLEDGGQGSCSATDAEADCVIACYEAGGCAAIDGTDEAASDALVDCEAGCDAAT